MATKGCCCKLGSKECCKLENKDEKLRSTVEFFDVLSDANRLKIMCVLRKQGMPVCDIWQYLDVSQNLVSHHLKVLKEFGLLESQREGKMVIYSLNKEKLEQYKALLLNFI